MNILWIAAVWITAIPVFAAQTTAIVRLKGKISIEQLAREVTDPNSVRFGHYFTPGEIRRYAAPEDADYQRALQDLREQGFQIVKESPTHLWVTVRGESERLKALMPDQHLANVRAVIGLDKGTARRPKIRVHAMASQPGGIPQSMIKTAYGFDSIYKSGVSGKGQDIAIATYNGFRIADVRSFYKQSKLSPAPSVDQVKFNGTPKYDENSAGETQLDAEFTGMIAPGAKIHVYASSTNDDAGEAAMFTAILDDDRAKIVNYSWGGCEGQVSAAHRDEMNKIFARAVAQGVNILVASGDSGSDSCQDGSVAADWPAANPYVVAVGGTTFAESAGRVNESAWNGSGGGISGLFDLPAYQSDLGTPFVRRLYPDVAFNADPSTGEAIYAHVNGKAGWLVVGGTSMAAPQWAGFLALVGSARKTARKPVLGFMNPLIYSLSSQDRAEVFNDVVSGNNGAYSASSGWDAVTGFGSMKADALLEYLATR